ncbi:MAG: AAA family ATPase [Thermoanaerobaculia bacterium]|nr:AAA family ATPase [Thermoanaerobaculia bacterium]
MREALAAAEPAPGFRSAAEVIAEAPRAEIVRDTVAEGAVAVLVGEPGAGKSFALLDLAAGVSEGRHFHGRKIAGPGSVAFLSFEGDAFALRLEALQQAGRDLANVYLLNADRPLSPVVERDGGEVPSPGEIEVTEALRRLQERLSSEGRPAVRLVIVDTVRASLAGSEDSSEGVSAYLRAIRRILATCPRAGCILAHHAGWQDGETRRRRERGSSAWRGNCDATFYLSAEGAEGDDVRVEWQTLKLRDAERPAPLRLIRRRVELTGRTTASGFPATSCVMVSDAATPGDDQAARAAKLEAEEAEIDRRILAALTGRDDVTSLYKLRILAGLRQATVSDSVARLARSGLLAPPGRKGDPYMLSQAGNIGGANVC